MSNTPDNEARTILGDAIMACNALIIHLNQHPDTFPAATRQRMIEADYLLNSAADDVADFVGSFAPPVAAEPIWQEVQEFSCTSTSGYTTTGLQARLTCGHWSAPVHPASSDWDFPYEEHQCPEGCGWVQYDLRVRDHLAATR